MRAGAKIEQMAMNELSGVDRIYGVAAVNYALLLRSGRKLIKLSEQPRKFPVSDHQSEKSSP
jgi:hypothetical protein